MDHLHGFTCCRCVSIPELQTEGALYRHDRTGAELLSLSNQDPNKVFGITFRTPPQDSTGVAHILEHSVLCGSRKYPVREPFVELLKGSLQTFLNAFTFPDKTCYPVASQNLQDFYNLIDVYLDAVFYPRLTPLVFDQEGWHLEVSPEGALSYRGVVYNEMRGAYSSADSLLQHYSQIAVFPDTLYALDSGGDPGCIPDLTFAQFSQFHRRYYHPANARIFFCGDDDPAERLRLVDAVLRDFDPADPAPGVPLQPVRTGPMRHTRSFPAGLEETRGMLTVNWLLPPVTDLETNLALTVLEHILIGMPASPLRKALIDSGLGHSLAGVGLEPDLAQLYFSTGLKGIDPAAAPDVEHLISQTLSALARDGIDPATAAAALNTVEFNLRENNSGSFPRGLVLMLRALRTWLHDSDPFGMLAFETPLARLQERYQTDPRLFSRMIQEHLRDNPHQAVVLLQPDPDLAQTQAADEAARLEKIRAALDDATLDALRQACRDLQQMQQTPDPPEALATIPRLHLPDIPRRNEVIQHERSRQGGIEVFLHDQPTNGILYLDFGMNLRLLPQRYLPWVTIFARALLETGTAVRDFVSLSQEIGARTGGIRSCHHTATIRDSGAASAWLFLRGKAVLSRAGNLTALLQEILHSARLDNRERIRQIVLEETSALEQQLVPAGHSTVARRLRAHFTPADWAEEQICGIDYLLFLRDLAGHMDAQWPAVQATLEEMRRILVNRSAIVVNCTVDCSSWAPHQHCLDSLLECLPDAPLPEADWQPERPQPGEGLIVPAQVNFAGKAVNLYSGGCEDDGSLNVIAHFLRTSWLWEQVRVQGGAYGAFSSFDRMSGTFVLASYRDPNLLETLAVFDRTAAHLQGLRLSPEDIEKSVIGVIGDIDACLLPDAKGFISLQRHLCGNTAAVRQKMREQVLATAPRHFTACGDALARLMPDGIVTVMGSDTAIAAANRAQPGLLRPRPLL